MVAYLQNNAHGSGDMDSDLTRNSWLLYSQPSTLLLIVLQQDKQTHRPIDIQKHHGKEKGSEVEGWPSSCKERASILEKLGYSFFSKPGSSLFSKYPKMVFLFIHIHHRENIFVSIERFQIVCFWCNTFWLCACLFIMCGIDL